MSSPKYWEGQLKKASERFGVENPSFDDAMADLHGASILNMGFHPDAREGGLTIDYLKDGEKKRIVLGFNELGMWPYWQGKLETELDPWTKLQLKMTEFLENGSSQCEIPEKVEPDLPIEFHSYTDGSVLFRLDADEVKLLVSKSQSLQENFTAENVWSAVVLLSF